MAASTWEHSTAQSIPIPRASHATKSESCFLSFVPRLQDYIGDETQDPEWRLWVWQHYGTSYRSIYTMLLGLERQT